MKKIVLIFGLIIGTILCINMIVLVNQIYTNPDFKGNNVVGYIAMIVLFSLIFFGIRKYRNQHLNGFISFVKAFKTGFLITLIASTMYVVVWLFYYYLFVPDFIEVYASCVLKNTPAAELPAKTAEMESFKEMYKNPLLVVLFTFAEVLPTGLIVTFLSALLLKKNDK
ncbi:MAG: DUF4199 domain-containing protein [Flavobacterium sp.]